MEGEELFPGASAAAIVAPVVDTAAVEANVTAPASVADARQVAAANAEAIAAGRDNGHGAGYPCAAPTAVPLKGEADKLRGMMLQTSQALQEILASQQSQDTPPIVTPILPKMASSARAGEDGASAAIDAGGYPFSRRDLPTCPLAMPKLCVKSPDEIITKKEALTSYRAGITINGSSNSKGTEEVLLQIKQTLDVSSGQKRAVRGFTVAASTSTGALRAPAMARDDVQWADFLLA